MKTLIVLFFFSLSLVHATMSARAIIQSTDRTIISSEIAGNIVYFPKEEGEHFSKGQILAKIDCSIYQAQKKKVNIQKNIAYQKMKKNEELDALKAIGSFEVLISKEEYNKQVAELDIVSINVKRCKIHAPFNGKVVSKKINLYENVKAQQELLEIIGVSKLEAKVIIPALWLQWLKKGDTFTLAIDETQTNIKATVKEIGAVVDPSSQMISIRANLLKPYDGIIDGMSGTAKFNPKK